MCKRAIYGGKDEAIKRPTSQTHTPSDQIAKSQPNSHSSQKRGILIKFYLIEMSKESSNNNMTYVSTYIFKCSSILDLVEVYTCIFKCSSILYLVD